MDISTNAIVIVIYLNLAPEYKCLNFSFLKSLANLLLYPPPKFTSFPITRATNLRKSLSICHKTSFQMTFLTSASFCPNPSPSPTSGARLRF